MPEWKQERPAWCPHIDCRFRARSQDSICIGELPEAQDHGTHKGVNTHRLCQRGAPDDGEWLHTVEWNKGDAWNLRRCIDAAFFPTTTAAEARVKELEAELAKAHNDGLVMAGSIGKLEGKLYMANHKLDAAQAQRDAALEVLGQESGAIAYQLTKQMIIDMPTARAAVDAARDFLRRTKETE